MADTVDPLAGSYYVEALTDEIERRARRSTSSGSTRWAARAKAIEAGYIQREIQDAAYARAAPIESGEQVVVGVNKFQTSRTTPARRSAQDRRGGAGRADRPAARPCGPARRRQRLPTCWPGSSAAAQDPAAPLMPLFVEAVERLRDAGRDLQHAARGVRGVQAVDGLVGQEQEERLPLPFRFQSTCFHSTDYARFMKKQPTSRMCFVCGESNPAGRARALLRAGRRLGAGALHAARSSTRATRAGCTAA